MGFNVYFRPAYARLSTIKGLTFPPVLTFNDAIVSGTPKLLRFNYLGNPFYVKAYPTISAENGSSGDTASNLYLADDAKLSGNPFVFSLLTTISGIEFTEYYFKAYPTTASDVHSLGALKCWPERYQDAKLSGAPRVAKILIGSTPYYFKTYPTKT